MTTPKSPPDRQRFNARSLPRTLLIGATIACLISARSLYAADPLLVVSDPTVVVRGAIDPRTKQVCGASGRLSFSSRRAAHLRVANLPESGTTLDGVAIGGSVDVAIAPGPHVLGFSGSILSGPTSARSLELQVRDAGSGKQESQTITLQGDVVNRSILPVGRMFLQGIDLMMGHVVTTSTDLKVAGRHLALDVGRTYSGSPGGEDGPTGVRWTFTHESRLTPIEECGLYVVTVAGGSSQTFATSDVGRTFVPQRGYHSSLVRLPDGSFDYADKAANRFHFAGPDASAHRTRRLLYFEEPHGDRLVYRYDPRGLLIEVAESQIGAPSVRLVARTLRLRWSRAGGLDRIKSISAPGLGLRVDYDYDRWGNLTTATRFDDDVADKTVERMTYSIDLASDRHRLLSFHAASGARVEYKYSARGPVAEVVERPEKGGMTSTTLEFEKLSSPTAPFRVITREGALAADVYDLSEEGLEVRTQSTDGLGRRVENVTWAPDDILKTSRFDNRGAETTYVHDARGNIVREITKKSRTAQPEVVVSDYHPRFNLLVRQVDAAGAESSWSLDPRTGDLLESRDAKGVVEKYKYDGYGRAIESQTAAGITLFLAHNTFGSATRVKLPSGKIETYDYDSRGRRYANAPETPEK